MQQERPVQQERRVQPVQQGRRVRRALWGRQQAVRWPPSLLLVRLPRPQQPAWPRA
ncbi:hypothetical protein ACFYNO_32490 [Kitasatospora sp. NPDC006697]|uniref:hypothetical protein n=1 Tax=Kitasatospora sp. NPDC006697 TaxID=3364020 RepID=UPI0036A8D626